MSDEEGKNWMSRLPWVLLDRRTAYQPDLGATAAELVMGANPTQPGDLIGTPEEPMTDNQIN